MSVRKRESRTGRRGLAALMAALMAISAGCAGSDRGAPQRPRPLADEERRLLSQAEARLTADCMRRQGFEYFVVEEPATQPQDFPYGNDDPTWAAAHGFGIAYAQQVVAKLRDGDPNHRYVAALPADRQTAYQVALDGDRSDPVSVQLPDGKTLHQSGKGCTADAQRRLYGDFAGWLRARTLVERLPADYTRQVFADPRHRAAVTSWAGCMADRGYPVADPAQLRERIPPATSGTPGRAEVRAAVVEAECAARTGMVRTARELERAYADRTYAENREVIEEYQRLSVHALSVAQEIAGAGR